MKNSAMWHYLDNQFDNRTNFKSMNTISSDHLSRLSALSDVPFFNELYDFFKPFRENFSEAYTDMNAVKGFYKGMTLNVKDLFKELKDEKLPSWTGKVAALYHKNTVQYRAIFFKGLKMFNKGAYETRISYLNTLAHHLKEYPELNDVRVEVEDFYNTLVSARNEQQIMEGEVKQKAENLHDAKRKLASAMYRNLGALMMYFHETPSKVGMFFEIKHIVRKTKKEAVEPAAEE